MSNIDIAGIKPKKHLFHNEEINTYEKTINFNEINYWPDNLRTILAFEKLESLKDLKLKDISLRDITNFLVSRSELKLDMLAKSIEKNGVRVPLIVLDDGTLLDGNRRYFACSYIYQKESKLTKGLKNIPVLVIKQAEITPVQKNKILAEANFVSDYKVSWSLDVKARVIKEYFTECLERIKDKKQAFDEVKDVYGLSRSEVQAYVDTIALTEEYILRAGDKKNELKLREHVLSKFVYFWEFRNKAYKGRGALEGKELDVVKPLFLDMIEKGFFKNIKQVEPMIRSYHHEDLWEILYESKGSKIDQVDLLFREQKTIKSSEDKVRNFLKWLRKSETKGFSQATHNLLEQLENKIKSIKIGD